MTVIDDCVSSEKSVGIWVVDQPLPGHVCQAWVEWQADKSSLPNHQDFPLRLDSMKGAIILGLTAYDNKLVAALALYRYSVNNHF